VKAAPFRYEHPASLTEALELLDGDEGSKALAGGQSLVPMMAMRLARPTLLVDLGGVADLDGVQRSNGSLVTGAMVRQRALERRGGLAREVPLVAAALPWVGHREIRNRGTIGGSVAHADPSAELSLVAAVLRATIVAVGSDGREREIPGDEFAHGPFQTALDPDDVLTEIRWPVATDGDGFAFAEVARRHGDFALCGAAVWVRYGGAARVGLMGVAGTPVVHDVRSQLDGGGVAGVADELAHEVDPAGDMHASAEYRRRLVRVLVTRCLTEALGHD
jgi:2-furoyl-CoA dehydrogenase FAD binding subunit